MVLKGKGMGEGANNAYTRIIYRVYKKIAPKLLHFGFLDDFRSKNGLPASTHNRQG